MLPLCGTFAVILLLLALRSCFPPFPRLCTTVAFPLLLPLLFLLLLPVLRSLVLLLVSLLLLFLILLVLILLLLIPLLILIFFLLLLVLHLVLFLLLFLQRIASLSPFSPFPFRRCSFPFRRQMADSYETIFDQ